MSALVDGFGRRVRYLRISVTDRCDFRCVYCMAEKVTFLPRAQLLTLEEIATLSQVFVELGVEKIRLTGGEPLVRQGVLTLVQKLGDLEGLRELGVDYAQGYHLGRPHPLTDVEGVRMMPR